MSQFKSNYYEIRLRELRGDTGNRPQNRTLQRNGSGRTLQGASAASQQTAENQSNGVESTQLDFIDEVVFDVSPTISESRTANYEDSALPGPIGIVVYATTTNRRFSISARFVSRNVSEATINYLSMNKLRSWLIPNSILNEFTGRPPTLRLNGYKNQFFNIPTVLSSLNINFPEDVDYIETDFGMVPIVQSVELELIEAHGSAIGFEGVADVISGELGENGLSNEFDLSLFKNGILPGY